MTTGLRLLGRTRGTGLMRPMGLMSGRPLLIGLISPISPISPITLIRPIR